MSRREMKEQLKLIEQEIERMGKDYYYFSTLEVKYEEEEKKNEKTKSKKDNV